MDKHVWRLDEHLGRDDFEQGSDFCDGPICILCGASFCRNCDPKGMEGECVSDPDEHERLPEQLRRYAELTGKLSGQLNDAEKRLKEAAKTLKTRDRQVAAANYEADTAQRHRAGAEYELAKMKEEVARLNMVIAAQKEATE